ncbi:MAG: hypothetical protein H5T86_07170 [Armatimonadetes bacterium]|nr:hypothetical protein [Armatimonadota bacterium]
MKTQRAGDAASRYGWRFEEEEVPLALSALAHHQFRRWMALLPQVPGLAHAELFACLVANLSDLRRVVRLELPTQEVSGALCIAYRESLREIADGLAPDERLIGSIHLHPMSRAAGSGFLSYTDFDLLEQTALEQSPDLMLEHYKRCSLPKVGLRAGATSVLRRLDGEPSDAGPGTWVLEGGAIAVPVYTSEVFAIVNAGPGYFGRALRQVHCPICAGKTATLHPVKVTIEPQDAQQLPDDGELLGLIEERVIPATYYGYSYRYTYDYGYGYGYETDYPSRPTYAGPGWGSQRGYQHGKTAAPKPRSLDLRIQRLERQIATLQRRLERLRAEMEDRVDEERAE